ncbi:mitochondrial escape protein 2 [Puccinia graminis f. sp. tritici]|uniref:Mitochondrial escape protein 2 n=1 Tax=Puccinia graminis f. sp. tritici TaxID=56615 RepID=A0A5B0RV46_PUCGR|nr:mitochondrial escape protein 2 [Puccinia graminis f. sp. tritici]
MPTPKDPIQIAHVTLDGIRPAAIARSCLHGLTYRAGPSSSSTRIRILYSPRVHAKTARDWLGSHPKIVLPILALLLGGISYTFFEPIRQFFIKSHIAGTFDLQQNAVFSWLQKETVGRLGFGRDLSGGTDLAGSAVEKERGDAVRELNTWLSGTPGTFFVVLGPKGSGKSQVVQSVLNERGFVVRGSLYMFKGFSAQTTALSMKRNSLVIDCASLIQDATNDDVVIANLAKSLGYFPQFSFFASVNNAIDMAAAGLVGQKVGFSSSPEDQMHQILDTAEKALRDLAKEASINRQHHHANQTHEVGNAESEKESIARLFQQVIESIPLSGYLTDKTSDAPVVVLKDFSINASAKHQVLWDCLASWACRLTESGTAHVIFTSENSGALKPLTQAFSTRPVRSIVLTDASTDSALQYVSKRLSTDPNRKSTVLAKDSALIQIVGGRLTDLDLLVQKIESGLDVERAIEEIVRQSMEEIKRKCFVHGGHDQSKMLPWANHQVWDLIKRLSSHDEVPLYPILSETFDDDLSVLSALELTDLITLSTHENGETMIRVGKPVYRTAIERLLSHKHFAATHDLNWAKRRMKRAEELIESKLHELIELGKLFPTIYTVGSDRQSWLFGSTLPAQIRWKVKRILDDLDRLEQIVDSAENDVKRAKTTLYSSPPSLASKKK